MLFVFQRVVNSLFLGLYTGNSFIQICIKCHAALAVVSVVLGVDRGFWEGKILRKTVEFSFGVGEPGGIGVTKKGEATLLMVPLMSLLYEKPI